METNNIRSEEVPKSRCRRGRSSELGRRMPFSLGHWNRITTLLFTILLFSQGVLFGQIVVDGNPSEWPAVLNNTTNVVKSFKHDPFNDNGNDDQWTGGSQDNDSTPVENWHWVYGNSNDKGDIGNAGVILIGTKLYFFGDRHAQNGTAEIGFWVFVDNVRPVGDGSNQTAKSSFIGQHSNGDLLVLTNFENGGKRAVPAVYIWKGKTATSPGGLQQVTGADGVIAGSDVNDVVYDAPNVQMYNGQTWSYYPKKPKGATDIYPINAFFEGYIDLSTIPGSTNCLRSFLMETRNSHQIFNASLQDLVSAPFTEVTLKLECPSALSIDCGKTQAQVNTEFATWLALFKIIQGGINPELILDKTNADAPLACGGSVTVTAKLRDRGSCAVEQTCSSTFTVKSSPPVDVTGPQNITKSTCDFKDQAAVDVAFAAWLADFKTLNNGCGAQAHFDKTPVAPKLCDGGIVTLVYSIADNCSHDSATATFTLNKSAVVDVVGPGNITKTSCDFADQAALDTAFAAWLADFKTNNTGCGSTAHFDNQYPKAPKLCEGGSVTLKFSIADLCTSDHVTATFTINKATAVDVEGPGNITKTSCDFANQAALDSAFATWLGGFKTVKNGCGATAHFDIQYPKAPKLCDGGSVTLVYSISDNCSQDSATATFTINKGPAVDVSGPANMTKSSCDFANQAALDSAFAAWLSDFKVMSNGCNATAHFDNQYPKAPKLCDGGSITLVYSISDSCTQDSATATFKVNKGAAVDVTGPANMTKSSCDFANQAALDSAFALWLADFKTINKGCDATAHLDNQYPRAPKLCEGGSVTLKFSIADNCSSDEVSATFTINKGAAVDVVGPANIAKSSCDFANQTALDSAFATWLAGFKTMNNGCGATAHFDNQYPKAPKLCDGGSITLVYSISDSCSQDTATATFTISKPDAMDVSVPDNKVVRTCDFASQADLQSAYDTWFAIFKAKGGCNPKVDCEKAPCVKLCDGGVITINFNVTDVCGNSVTKTRTFTVIKPDAMDITAPDNKVVRTCDFASQADLQSAYDAWFAIFKAKGGCNPKVDCEKAPCVKLCDGGVITINFNVTDVCGNSVTKTRTFTVIKPDAMDITAPDNKVVNTCDFASQADLQAAYDTWFAIFKAKGGCSPKVDCAKPSCVKLCDGGVITINFNVTDVCGTSVTKTRTFTVNKPVLMDITAPDNKVVNTCDFASQADLQAAYDTWFAIFKAKGGCSPKVDCAKPSCVKLCDGGVITINFNVTDVCGTSVTKTRTFTVNKPVLMDITAPDNKVVNTCDFASQADLQAAYDTWFAIFKAKGGCSPKVDCAKPSCVKLCDGGVITINFKVTDVCGNSVTKTRTFTVVKPDAMDITAPDNKVVKTCDFASQADLQAAYDTWFAIFKAKGGCNPKVDCAKPSCVKLCDGGVITINFKVTDVCGNSVTKTRTFTVIAPSAADIKAPENFSASSCTFANQAAVDAKFADFLKLFIVKGGCAPKMTCGTVTAPNICGGKTNVTFTITDICGHTSTVTRSFEITAPSAVDIKAPENFSANACDFASQAAVDAKFADFLKLFTVKGGCDVKMTCGTVSAPNLCGGKTNVTFTITDKCNHTSTVTRSFEILAPAQVKFTCGTDVSVAANSTEEQIKAAWLAFLASTKASGGCNGVLTNNATAMPSACGGYVDVTWTYKVSICGEQSGCGAQNSISCTKRFTVGSGTNVIPTFTNCPSDVNLGCNPTSFPSATATSADVVTGGVLGNPVNIGDCTWTRTRVWTATNSCGGKATCTQVLTYNVDTDAPVFSGIADKVIAANSSDSGECGPDLANGGVATVFDKNEKLPDLDKKIGIEFSQPRNQDHPAEALDWTNGSLNQTQAEYFEGMGVPQRLILTGLKGTTHTVRIRHEAVKHQSGDRHAYDFLMSWEQAIATAANIGNGAQNELQDLMAQQCNKHMSKDAEAVCGKFTTSATAVLTDNMGNPPNHHGNKDVNDVIQCFESQYGDRSIKLEANAPISDFKVVFEGYSGTDKGDNFAWYTVTWTSTSPDVELKWAGRAAQGGGDCGYGACYGAGSISGNPYHMILENIDGALGQRDNQVKVEETPVCDVNIPVTFDVPKVKDCDANVSVVITTSDAVTHNSDGSVSHTRTWKATDKCLNVSTASQTIKVVCPENLDTKHAAKTAVAVGFEVYPVPFKDQLTVKYNFDYKSDVKIEMIDILGRILMTQKDNNPFLGKEVILHPEFAPQTGAVYLVRVSTNRGVESQKVISGN